MRTYHISALPKGMTGRKIKLAEVTREDGEQAKTNYREGHRMRLNSRQARHLRRRGEKLIAA